VVLRPEAIRQRLLRLESVVSHLEELARSPAESLRTSVRDAWAVERGLQLGAEILFDVGNHVLTAGFGVSTKDYEDILVQLERVGVLDGALARRLKGLGGFRNLLVHDYVELDSEKVTEALTRAPHDYTAFALALRRWLERSGRKD
jgi:uncharacterized protein YutE (UPF0331/DUF86 family)